jgi:alpha/beta superfamily hydrolase
MDPVRFSTSDGVLLEGELRAPDGEAVGTAVICHAHPERGGSKDHPLLWAVRNDLATRRGLVVLGFNFRGVMGSEGTHGGGKAELADVAAAVERVRKEAEGPTLLVGWSFGAAVSLRYGLTDGRVSALALIGTPLAETPTTGRVPELPSRAELAALEAAVLLIAGEADPICPVPDLRRLERQIPNAELVVIPDTDHFFWRRERDVATAIGDFADRTFGHRSAQ